METVSVGRIVHYVSYGTPNGEYTPEHRAAIITAYDSDNMSDRVRGSVSLCVMNPTGLFFNSGVGYDPNGTGGTWHWPERVEE